MSKDFSRRDHIAIQAMQGLLAGGWPCDAEGIAKKAVTVDLAREW